MSTGPVSVPGSSLPHVDDGRGHLRPLGFIPTPPEKRLLRTSYRDVVPAVPEADWRAAVFDRWPAAVAIKDQDQKGACNGHGAALAMEFDRALQGKPHVPLSAWFVYSILCNGVDEGSMISDDLALLETKGCAPESEVPYGTIDPHRLTPAAYQAALRYRARVGAAISTVEEIMTAVIRRHGVVLSVCVGSNFNSLDDEGVPPIGRGPGNHAVFVGGGIKPSRKHGWLVKMANSWTTEWGLNGFCWLPPDVLVRDRYFEGVQVGCVADDPNEPGPPAV